MSAEIAADNIRIIMGATDAKKDVTVWKGETESLGSGYFIPSSLTIED